MFLQVNLVTGEVEKGNHKERGQIGEQMELDALTSISASLYKGKTHQHMNPLPKRNTWQDSNSEATEWKQSMSLSLTVQQVKIQSYHFLTAQFINLFWIWCSYLGFLYHLIEFSHNSQSKLQKKKQRTRLSNYMFLLLAHTHFSFSGVRSSWRISFPHSLIGLDRLSKLFLNSILFSTVLLCFVLVLRHSLKCEKSKFFLPSI